MFVGCLSHWIGLPFFTEFVVQHYKKENICVKQVLQTRLYWVFYELWMWLYEVIS